MPVQLTYPGVYIQELPSGVRTIAGVATSIAVFVGWAPQGPVVKAGHIYGFSDYQRAFGDIHPESDLGVAVKHFFDNGGSEAYVVRLVDSKATAGAVSVGGLDFIANNPGSWSQFYGVSTKAGAKNRFRVAVVQYARDASGNIKPDAPPSEIEVFENLSAEPNDARYVYEVLADEKRGSQYVALSKKPAADTTVSTVDPTPFSAGAPGDVLHPGDDGFLSALEAAHAEGAAFDSIDLFNLLCVPGLTDTRALGKLLPFCKLRRAFLIADSDQNFGFDQMTAGPGIDGGDATNYGALYYPWIRSPDPLSENRIAEYPPCGFVAGIFARTDATRGVWKAPAGIDAGVVGAVGPKLVLNDNRNGTLNIKAVNCFRSFPVYNTVVWGARTLEGDDERGSEWKYIPVRRTALYIEESLYRGLKWVVFEPNDEPLWSMIRVNVGAFMRDLFRKGAFQGRSPREAYFVRCDSSTTTQSDINRGIVNIIVGFAPLKPAEFVVLSIQQIAGDIQT